jgi:hypothetical protein
MDIGNYLVIAGCVMFAGVICGILRTDDGLKDGNHDRVEGKGSEEDASADGGCS